MFAYFEEGIKILKLGKDIKLKKICAAVLILLLFGCARPLYKNSGGAIIINAEHDDVIDLQTEKQGEYLLGNGSVYFDVEYTINENSDGYLVTGYYAFNDYRDSKAQFKYARLSAAVSDGTHAIREIKADCTSNERRCDFKLQVDKDFRYVYLAPEAEYTYYRFKEVRY
jgi:hypothetical protein